MNMAVARLRLQGQQPDWAPEVNLNVDLGYPSTADQLHSTSQGQQTIRQHVAGRRNLQGFGADAVMRLCALR